MIQKTAIIGVVTCIGMLMTTATYVEAAPVKIAYVDLQRTLNETKIGKEEKKKLEQTARKHKSDLAKERQRLEKKAEEFGKKRAVLKPEIAVKQQRELEEEYIKLQERYVKIQREVVESEAKAVNSVFKRARPIINKIGERENYTVILEKTESMILFAKAGIDITNEVNRLLDK